MKRRFLAIAAAAATALAVAPAAPAFAAPAATAALTGTTTVFPGTRTFTINVTNNAMPVVGETINAIRVNFPVNEAGISLGNGPGSATGFTGTATNLGSTQFITYRGGSVPGGSSVSLTFPATVAAPLAKDLTGAFRVQVSSDNFQTASTATGALAATVQVLEIVTGSVKPVAPTNGDNTQGVTDRTGTAGQNITYGSTVRNYSRSALTVTAGLTSASDTVSPATITVPAGAEQPASIPVTLGAAGGRTLSATATAPGASATPVPDSFTVQAPALLSFSSLDGQRAKSGVGSARDFAVSVSKTGAQAASLATSALTFGSNTCGVVGTPAFPAGNATQTLTYRCGDISGSDGPLDAAVSYTLSDDNLATYGNTGISVGKIIIDNVRPVLTAIVTLPQDADKTQQTAVKNGDTVTVNGTVSKAAYLANGGKVRVSLTPNAGPAVTQDVTPTGSGDTRDWAATFSGTAWDAAASRFTASASATDTAGNTGSGSAPGATVIDNVLPALLNPGTVVNPTTVEVSFADATGVKGGCDPSLWQLDSKPGQVSSVAAGDGKPCDQTASTVRRLTLSSPLGVDATPTVTYNKVPAQLRGQPGAPMPAKDGAGNDALSRTIDTVTNLVPAAPQIVSLQRHHGSSSGALEPAYLDTTENRYYTNNGGAEALQLTVGGVKQNYVVQVLRAGQIVAQRSFTAAPPVGASSYNGDILVPLRTTDGVDDFTVRLVSSQGNAGQTTPFSVVLDTVAPALAGATINGSTVTQTFSEKVVTGTDYADSWFVSEWVQGESGPVKRTVNVDSVTAVDATTRTMQVTLVDPTKFAGTDYYLQTGTRYEDRAGNTLADTLRPAA